MHCGTRVFEAPRPAAVPPSAWCRIVPRWRIIRVHSKMQSRSVAAVVASCAGGSLGLVLAMLAGISVPFCC